MKVVQIIPNFALAGAETMCATLSLELAKLGHKTVIISMYNCQSALTNRLAEANIDVRYLGKKPGFDFSTVSKMRRIFKEIKPDVIHSHLYCSPYAMLASVNLAIKVKIHTIHSLADKEDKGINRKLNRLFFKHFNLVPVALSGIVQASIATVYGLPSSKIPVILNGADLSRCIAKESYEINGGFKIIHVGSFTSPKNHAGLIKAFKLFHDNHNESELWLVGDGPERGKIEALIADFGLKKSVKLLGICDNVCEILCGADVFAMPSNYEGIPMALIEAMGSGLPIVATAVGGIPDMLTNGVDAILVSNEVATIANAFEQYYLSLNLRKHHGQNAKIRSKDFSSAKMAEKYARLYENVTIRK